MAIILLAQFNSFYQAALILTAVMFSVVGVLLGLLITDQPFGIVMSGVGVIALAGIVVNNNIVLIDTYNRVRHKVDTAANAALITCAQRLRPVMLTTITTILGLMPMVLGINVDVVSRDIEIGSPSTQWWTQLASTVVGGLAFATLLTLLLTPCLLVVGERFGRYIRRKRAGFSQSQPQPAQSQRRGSRSAPAGTTSCAQAPDRYIDPQVIILAAGFYQKYARFGIGKQSLCNHGLSDELPNLGRCRNHVS